MNDSQLIGSVVQPPASVASTATTTCMFDTLGFDYAVARVFSGTQTTTDPAITTCKWLESDDTVVSNFAAIVALTGGTVVNTTSGYVIPAVTVTGVGAGIEFQIDLRKRKRYLQLNITPGTTLVLGAHVALGRAEQSPLTAATKSIRNQSATNVTGVATLVQA